MLSWCSRSAARGVFGVPARRASRAESAGRKLPLPRRYGQSACLFAWAAAPVLKQWVAMLVDRAEGLIQRAGAMGRSFRDDAVSTCSERPIAALQSDTPRYVMSRRTARLNHHRCSNHVDLHSAAYGISTH